MVLMSRAWCDWRVWVVLAVCGVSQGAGSATVFRCGEVYTNQRVAGQGCEPVTGGQVSVIGAPQRAATQDVVKPAPLKGSKAQDPAQADKALAVLRAELAQAENRLAQAQAERASGSAAAEQAHSRAAADVQSLQREIARWSRP